MNNFDAPTEGKSFFSLGSHINELVVTFWTCASFYLMYATGGQNEFVLFIPLAVGAVALVAMTFNKPVIARVDRTLTVGAFMLSLSILGSYLFNADRLDLISVAGNLASTALLFIALYAITMKIDLDFRKTLILQTLVSTPVFLIVLATSHDQWGRVMPAELTPNYVGMMGLVCFVGACAARHWLWTPILAILPLYVIVSMESRGALASVCMAGLVMLWCLIRRLGWRKLRPYTPAVMLGVPILCIGLYFLGLDPFSRAYNAVDNLFMLHDEYRGVDSGVSGRGDLWQAAVNLWLSHPIFGVGFKEIQDLMPDEMPAHNAYLGMLAQVGTVGFVSYLLILLVGLFYTLKRGERGLSAYPERVAILASYLVYGLIESRAFGFGNTYTLLFMMVVFDSSKHWVSSTHTAEIERPLPSAESPQPVAIRA